MTRVTRSLPRLVRLANAATLPLAGLLLKTSALGARTTVHACLAADFATPRPGRVPYLQNCTVVPAATEAYPDQAAEAAQHLWEATAEYAANERKEL
mmetsp:Transcript_16473/g.49820  ORF Transcript_16473/g.49820 Transcript_16473/m.49820 type:complete len:97 (-) Transcript_16473:94-384(-)